MLNARLSFEINDWHQTGFGMPKTGAFSKGMRHAETNGYGGGNAVLVGFQPEERARLAEELSDIGIRSASARLAEFTLPGLSAETCSASHLFINLDAFDDIEDGIGQLMALRAEIRDLTVVLCSANIRGDDLGSERSALCDVTLKLPMTDSRLRAGLRAARENREGKRILSTPE